ncbi:preprotein translocase subunit SecE [Krasilnikovia sp. MM14-A1004]|uniref:preprotein translocase subunit SecE n=1 Tax=Krasilnikovia sp. MM14-A1004 TaxID=3373541 RepID=UPI00399D2366
MAERKRPGDDAADGRPDNEVPDDATFEDAAVEDDLVEDDEPVSRGGTAVRERKASAESPKAKKEGRVGIFGRIGGFFREVVSELRKVIWPTRKELLTYTGVVIAFVAIMTAIVAVLDFGFAKAVLFAFGGKSS